MAEDARRERKVVTVLFADLVGFTARAETLDPEDVEAILVPYHGRLRAELERFGGTVEKFIGDAVMALFGAPVAHEDDPERAVRAALAIRDWAREEGVEVRIAVNTGEALVKLGVRPEAGEGMAAGDVVNTTARLQSAAPVNGVLVGETTYRATREVIEYAEHDAVAAKGKSEPVSVWEVVQARSRVGMDLEQRALLPLVGRTRELETLVGTFDRVCRESEPHLVTLVGAPGIGKSRLVAELFARIDASPDIVWWRQGRALPYGQGVSFWALTEMVKAQAGIQENDATADVGAKIQASVGLVVPEDEAPWLVQHLLPLVGVEHGDAVGRDPSESFTAWRRYFEALADQRPLVLVFEDLHWADDGLLDFVDHLADWASGVPLLLLATSRPELLDRRPGWGGGKLNATTLGLTPLADDEAARVIAGVLDRAVLPAETQRTLLERAGGNPLYAEQFARLYVERGSADGLEVPETVQGIIAARLDALAPDEKRVLQDVAVVGKVFWLGAAAELTGLDPRAVVRALHSLERKGLVRRERRSSVGGQGELAFRHVLVRDVAYGQIPRATRGEKHVGVATWIEGLGRLDDHAELVAHHYASALELVRAAGSVEPALAERARVALRRAGDRAIRLYAFDNAKRFYAEALAIWPDDGDRPYVMLSHAQALYLAESNDAELAGAQAALEALGDVEAAAEAAAFGARAAWYAGRSADAEALLDRARSLLDGRPPSRAFVEALAEAARLATFGGRREEGIVAADDAVRLAEELGVSEVVARARTTRAVQHQFDGELDAAEAILKEVVELAPTGSAEMVRALTNLSVVEDSRGDVAAMEPWHMRAVEAARRTGNRPMLLWLEVNEIRSLLYACGRWDESVARATACLESVAAIGGHQLERFLLLLRAAIQAARGNDSAAEADLERALADLGPTMQMQVHIPTLVEGSYVGLLLGGEQRARELLERALPLVARGGHRAPGITADAATTIVRAGLADAWVAAAAHWVDTPRVRAARMVLAGRTLEAAELYEQMTPTEEAVTRLLAARQLAEQGRRAEADVQLRRALAFYRSVGATSVVRDAESLLASTA